MSKQIKCSLILMLAAVIWGVAFVAQSEGGDAVGALSFNCARSLLGAVVLMPVIAILDCLGLSPKKPKTKEEKKTLLVGGIACGVPLFLASNAQQIGITSGTGVGKAGFLTACYILIVPILGLFMRKKCGWNIWLGALLSLIGLYQLCLGKSMSFETSDLFCIACAFLFSIQIIMVDKYSPICDSVRLSCIEFATTGILGIIPSFIWDMEHSVQGVVVWLRVFTTWDAWMPLLYAGIMSCGVAYTFQIIGQNGLNPTVASMIMSLEAVFSVLAGVVLLHQYLSPREIVGCVVIFVAIVLAQLPVSTLKKKKSV